MGPACQISEIKTEAFQVISERSLVSTGSFAEKTRTAYCENLCVVFIYNSLKSSMLRDLSICSLLRER